MNIQTKVLEGKPLTIGNRKLVPIVQQTTRTRQKATVGARRYSAWGGGFVHLHPLGVVEHRDEERLLVPIPDKTNQALWNFAAVAIIVPLLLTLAARLARR